MIASVAGPGRRSTIMGPASANLHRWVAGAASLTQPWRPIVEGLVGIVTFRCSRR